MTVRRVALSFVLSISLCLGPAVAAGAPADVVTGTPSPSVVTRGRCSLSSHWRLTIRRVDRSLRVTLVVGSGRSGQRWNVFMDHNRRGFFAGSRISRADGTIRVKRPARDLPGIDRFRVGANNTVTGEACRGRVRT